MIPAKDEFVAVAGEMRLTVVVEAAVNSTLEKGKVGLGRVAVYVPCAE